MMNEKVAGILYEIADLLELKEERFKPQAYRKAARNIESLQEDIVEVYKRGQLRDIPGVGEAIEAKVKEIIETGELRYLKELHDEFPAGLMQVMDVPEIGPKTTMRLYKELRVTNVQDLKVAAEQHRIRRLKGFGDRTEENILKGVEFLETEPRADAAGLRLPGGGGHRFLLEGEGGPGHGERGGQPAPHEGDHRRHRHTGGDGQAGAGQRCLRLLSRGGGGVGQGTDEIGGAARQRHPGGPSGGARRAAMGPRSSTSPAPRSTTSSSAPGPSIRGYKLNEYGLFLKDSDQLVASATEEEVYLALGMDIMPPEMREDQGEIELSERHALPELVSMSDVKGDLHMHTEASDGAMPMEDMARAAMAKGYHYVGITDHSESLRIANGLGCGASPAECGEGPRPDRLLGGIHVLIGAEVEIDEQGKLDYPSPVLAELDYVIGAVHTRFKMSETEMTARLLTALSNDHLNILAHPTGRAIGQREAYPVDMEKLLDEAKAKQVFLEVNSFPERLDLNDRHCRMARDNGNMLVVNTDSHHPSHLDNMVYGVAQARRGWVGPDQVLNTLPLAGLERALRR